MVWWAIWFIVCGILFALEMLTLTFYLLWLSIGALVAGIIGLIEPDALALQMIIGAATALILSVFTKPLTRRIRNSRGYKDTIEDLVGKEGFIVEPVEPGKSGIVKVGNETWSAAAEEPLAVGDKVEVVSRGTTVLVVRQKGG